MSLIKIIYTKEMSLSSTNEKFVAPALTHGLKVIFLNADLIAEKLQSLVRMFVPHGNKNIFATNDWGKSITFELTVKTTNIIQHLLYTNGGNQS